MKKTTEQKQKVFFVNADVDRNVMNFERSFNNGIFSIKPKKYQLGWVYDLNGFLGVLAEMRHSQRNGKISYTFSILIDLENETIIRNFTTTNSSFYAASKSRRDDLRIFLRGKINEKEFKTLIKNM